MITPTAPARVTVYVCTNPRCGQWTVYRRRRCAWCNHPKPLRQVTYAPLEGEEAR